MTTGNAPTIEHSCSYYCDRPECVKAQRDELREKLAALEKPAQKKQCRATLTNGSWDCDCKFKHPIPCAKNAESQPVSVEPFRRFRGVLKPVDRGMWVNGPCDYYHDAEVDTRIDSLQSALRVESATVETLTKTVESFQSALKLAQERIKYYEAITTGAEHSAIDKAMSAELLKDAGE